MPDMNALGSSEKVLLAAAVAALVIALLTVIGFVPWLVGQFFALLRWLLETGFWLWERVLAGIPWPLLALVIVSVHVILYYNSGPIVTVLLGLFLLTVGLICCLAYIAIDQERLEVGRGYKALHNPARGQQWAGRLAVHGPHVGLPLLLVATLACVSGFALFNEGLSESIGADWYAPGHHRRYHYLNAEELAEARASNPKPEYPDFLVYSLLNLASAFDFIDVINLANVSRVNYVHPNRWPASMLLVLFRVFFTAVLLQQILSFFGKVRLIQECVRDFWSPHEPIQRRAGENLAQLGGRAVDNLLRSVELIEYMTPEQRDLLLRIIGTVGPSTIPLLVGRLDSPRPLVREIAMVGLGRLRALETLPRLVTSATDENEGVRLSLVEALEMVASEEPAAIRRRWRLQRQHRRAGQRTWWTHKDQPEADIDPVALTVQTLRTLLGDPARSVRVTATRLLGRFGAEARSAAAELARLALDSEESVREQAVLTLGEIGGPVETVIPALLAVLQEEQLPHVRVAALHALGRFGSAAAPAAAVLTALVQDREKTIRTAAAETLRRIGTGDANQPGGLDEPVIRALVEGLLSRDNQVRIQAAAALGTIGPSAAAAVPALITALGDRNDGVRVRVARALGELREAGFPAVFRLAQALHDPDFTVAAEAARAMGRIGAAVVATAGRFDASGALASLLKSSRHSNPVVRTRVAEALARIEAEPLAVLPCLVEMTHDADDAVRAAALAGLAGKTSIGAIRRDIFLAALDDESPAVRAVAVAELPHLDLAEEDLVARLLHAVDDVGDIVQTEAVQGLAERESVPDAVVARLCRLLIEDSPTLQLVTLRALGRFGPQAIQVVPTLLHILQRADTEIRAEALHAASCIAPQETLPLFLGGLHDSDATVRRRASAGLVLCKDIPEDQIGSLAEAIRDPDEEVRSNVVSICLNRGMIRPEMYPALAACLAEPNDELRRNAMQALQGAPYEVVEEMLPRLLDDPLPAIRLQAAIQMLHHDPANEEARQIVTEAARSSNDRDRTLIEEKFRGVAGFSGLFERPKKE